MSVEDKWAIYEVCSRQDNAYDSVDLEKFLDTWTEDAVFNSDVFGTYQGRAALESYFHRLQSVYNGKRHILTNHEIHVDGNTATMYCYLIVFERMKAHAVIGMGTFTDQLRKEADGKWRFARRDQIVDPGMTADPAQIEALKKYLQGETDIMPS